MGLRGKDARERAFRAFSTRFSGPSRPTCTAKSGPKGNRLTIGPNGSVKANVNACAVVVQGKLEGNIHASDRVDLKQSAIVVGDIATQRISIDEGAHLKGGVSIQKEAPKKEVLGGIAVSRSEAAQRRIFLRLPEGEVSTVLLSLLKEMDGMVLMLGVLLCLASGNPVRNLAIVDALIVGLCILEGDTASFALDDRHWQYVSGIPLVGGDLPCGRQQSLCSIG